MLGIGEGIVREYLEKYILTKFVKEEGAAFQLVWFLRLSLTLRLTNIGK